MVPSTLSEYHKLHQVQKSSSMNNQAKYLHGHLTVSLDGTLAQRLTTVDATQHTSQKQEENKSWTQYIFYPLELKCQQRTPFTKFSKQQNISQHP